jgi:hypothetical protein
MATPALSDRPDLPEGHRLGLDYLSAILDGYGRYIIAVGHTNGISENARTKTTSVSGNPTRK